MTKIDRQDKARETDAENRERAIALLQKAKEKELKKGLIPLAIGDIDKTILMISPKLNHKQREKLRAKKLAKLSQRHIILSEKEM